MICSWMPVQGVKQCMSCQSTFPKQFLGSSKENCKKCGRVVCKQCLKNKIKNIKVCIECFELRNDKNVNNLMNNQHIPNLIKVNSTSHQQSPSMYVNDKNNLYQEYENGIKRYEKVKQQNANNPYLSEQSLTEYEQQFDTNISPQTRQRSSHGQHGNGHRRHSACLSTASTVAVPYTLLDLTTDCPLPNGSKAPPSKLLNSDFLIKEDDEFDDEQLFNLQNHRSISANSISTQRKSFRERKLPNIQSRPSSASVDSLQSAKSQRSESNSSLSSIMSKRKSVTTIKWLENNEKFQIDEKRMKEYEDLTYTKTKIQNTDSMIVRLDGYQFGINLTNQMEKPFDIRFHAAMVNTACDILKEFECYTVFIQSDEFVLFWPFDHIKQKKFYCFGGKICKILSIISSFASVRLVHYLKKEFKECDIMRGNNCFASFDGKCFNIPQHECFDYLLWRLKKNIRGYKKIYTVGNEFCHGTYVKKEKYKKGKKERERITSCSVQIESENEKYDKLLSDRYWNNDFLKQAKNEKKESSKSYSDNEEDVLLNDDRFNTMIVHKTTKNQKKIIKNKNNERVQNKNKNLELFENMNEINQRVQVQNASNNYQRAQSTQIAKKPKYEIIPKRNSLPAKTKGVDDVYTLAAKFENSNSTKKRRNGITPTDKLKISGLDPSNNRIYAEPKDRIYDTMIVHNDITENDEKSESVKYDIRPKKMMKHKPYTPKYANSNSMRTKPKLKIKPLPAAANPNYQYNFNINLNDNKSKNKQKEVVKDENCLKASDRIKMINQRLQNINSTNY